jgi:acyl-CoA reductase-like NAD-dependent aldehyde dehydrogenase
MKEGAVWINKHFDILPYVTFGGAKNSGLGRELGEDVAEFT